MHAHRYVNRNGPGFVDSFIDSYKSCRDTYGYCFPDNRDGSCLPTVSIEERRDHRESAMKDSPTFIEADLAAAWECHHALRAPP